MRRIAGIAVLVFAVTTVAGCSGAGSSGSVESAAEIVSSRCTRCHPIDRVKTKSADAAGWKVTVDAMRAKGAVLTEEEAQVVVEFLAGGGAGNL